MSPHRILLTVLVAGYVLSLPAQDFTPGAHKRLPCDGNKEWTWDVYVPKAYAEKKDKKFPVVWCCGAGGNPGFWQLEQWAEKNWMYNYQRVAHPKLPPEDKAAVKKEIVERIKACGGIQTPAARLSEAETLMDMPDVDKLPDFKMLVLTWFKASRELAEAKTDAAEKHEDLFMLVDNPRSRLVPAAETQAVIKLLTELRKDPTVRTEWTALQIYARIQKMEAAAGQKASELKMAADGYRALAQKYPNTRAGKDAAEDANRMEAKGKK